MKIGVAGTGAVGGYFGAFLKKAGHDVVFLERGKNYQAMKEKGLRIEGEEGSFQVDGFFTDQYDSLSEVDLLLFSVKSTATREMALKLHPILKEDCLIMTLQNGVDNEEILDSIFGKARVLSAASYIQSALKEPGVVKQIKNKPFLTWADSKKPFSVLREYGAGETPQARSAEEAHRNARGKRVPGTKINRQLKQSPI